jgi:hypothetical protein
MRVWRCILLKTGDLHKDWTYGKASGKPGLISRISKIKTALAREDSGKFTMRKWRKEYSA